MTRIRSFYISSLNLATVVSALVKFSTDSGTSNSTIRIVTSFVQIICAFLTRGDHVIDAKTLRRLGRDFRSMTENINHFETESNGEYDYVKYHTDSLMCKLFDNPDLPELEDSEWLVRRLFTGLINRVIKRALMRRDPLCDQLIFSLQKGSKACWLPPSQHKLVKVMDKHAAAFSRPLQDLPWEFEKVFVKGIRSVFSKKNMGPRVKLCPSSSASYEHSRLRGGAASSFSPMNSPVVTGLGSLFDLNQTTADYRQGVYNLAKHKCKTLSMDYVSLLKLLASRIAKVNDPGKFRLVSCHDSYMNTALQPLQGQLLSAWKKTWFSSMRDADCSEKVNEVSIQMADMPLWISGDYSAATDMLNKNTGLLFVDVLKEMGVSDWEIAYASLVGGPIVYPEVKDFQRNTLRPRQWISGTNGQPMGSVLSFPILCMVNLAAYWWACDIYYHEHGDGELLRRMKRWVIVNGDDILFKSDDRFYLIWKRCVAGVGFKLSQGKNFSSPHHCMINSQLFRTKKMRDGSSVMIRQGYLNLGMVYGMDDGEVSNPTQLSQGLNEMFRLCEWSKSCLKQVINRFDQRYGWFVPNWFIPIELGGIGIHPEHSLLPIIYTRHQRKMATRFFFSPELSLYRKMLSTGGNIGGVSLKNLKVFKLLTRRARMVSSKVYGPDPPWESEISESGWLEKVCLAQYLMNPRIAVDDSGIYSNTLLKKKRTVNPMRPETINSFWSPRWLAARLPNAPPPNIISPLTLDQYEYIDFCDSLCEDEDGNKYEDPDNEYFVDDSVFQDIVESTSGYEADMILESLEGIMNLEYSNFHN